MGGFGRLWGRSNGGLRQAGRVIATDRITLDLPVPASSEACWMFFLTRHSRSAPVTAACFHIPNPKKPQSARHNMPLLRLGNMVFASAISLVA